MKATGEVMAIDRTFESAFMKAIRGLEVKPKDLRHPKFQEMEDEPLEFAIRKPTDERLWAIAEGLRRGWGVERVNKLSRVDKWFLRKIETLLAMEHRLIESRRNSRTDGLEALIEEAFLLGFPSPTVASLLEATSDGAFGKAATEIIDRVKVAPVFKMVDTCAGEFESQTPYYYGTFEQEDDVLHV
jgi:carbamoyl-phosphate synthase large subunit